MLPSIFKENLFDDMFGDAFDMIPMFGRFSPIYGNKMQNAMKTDVRETKENYEIDVDLPGFKKEDIQVHLENGYLTIAASTSDEKEEKNKKGEYLRKERYTGRCSRSFYIGATIKEEDIHAKFDNGILTLTLPKKKDDSLSDSRQIGIE